MSPQKSPQDDVREKTRPNRFERPLNLLLLCGFAVAQPLFDLLSGEPGFFVARRSSAFDVVALAAVLIIAPPLVFSAIESVIGLFGDRPRQNTHVVIVGLLIATTTLPPLNRIGGLPALVSVGVSVLLGVVGACLYRRVPRIRSLTAVAAPVVVVFVAVFLLDPSIWKIIHPKQIDPESVVDPLQATPIVLVIFDGLPLVSLMDESREVDSGRYPNFADLASTSTWFRNATTVSDATMRAIPAILTGQYPEKGLLPVVQDYPGNLLTVLDSSYDIYALEPVTRFSDGLRFSEEPQIGFPGRMGALLGDVWVVYLHLLTPEAWSGGLPPIANQWTGFDKRAKLQASTEFDAFVHGIEATTAVNKFFFVHSLLPHPPHLYFPSGATYTKTSAEPSGEGSQWGAWSDNEWAVLQSYKRHLLQVGFSDTMLGRLLARLRETGLFEKAIIVVTADHGMSFVPGDSRRGISKSNFADIMPVPLFIKQPFQQTGAIDDAEVELVDIFPTVAELLAIEQPWPQAGRSVFDRSAAPRINKLLVGRERMVFEASRFDAKYESLERKIALFGSGSSLHRLFEMGPFGEDLVGKKVSDLEVADGGEEHIRVLNEKYFKNVDPDAKFVPAEITGTVVRKVPSSQPLALAVAVNGIIRATTWSYPSDSRSAVWSALVEERAFRAGTNTIEVYPIRDSEEGPLLFMPREDGAVSSFLDMRLGAARVPGVAESGFNRPSRWANGKPVRWTNGSAKLTVPIDVDDPPTAIRVDLAWIGPVNTTFKVFFNGHEVLTRSFQGEPYPAPKKSLVVPLRGVRHRRHAVIQLSSDTFVPAMTIEGSNDGRHLGVAVEGVWLLRDLESAEAPKTVD